MTVTVNYVDDNSAAPGIIYYRAGQLLSWQEFQGKPLSTSDAAALTSAGFGIGLEFRSFKSKAELVINVNCSFSKKNSWVKPANKTPYILNHEQKHFDITYLHTLLFIQQLRKALLTGSNYAAVIEKIYQASAYELSKVQHQYDLETSHSRMENRQAAWDEKISREIVVAQKQIVEMDLAE